MSAPIERNSAPRGRIRRPGGVLRPLVATLIALLVTLLATLAALAAESGKKPVAWLTGKRFEQQLAQKMNLTWAHLPLAEALASLSASTHVATLLDRRIDPGQFIDLVAANREIEDVLREIAATEHIGVSLWEPLVYFGPPSAATALRTLAWLRREDLARLPVPRRQALSAVKAWEWNDLATPRDLLSELAAEARVKLEGQDLVPHDLWPGRRLPPMAWIDRLTLVAIQFELTFELADDGKTVRLVPMPAKVTVRRSFPAGRKGTPGVSVLAERYPQTVIHAEGDEIVADGPIEELEALARQIAGKAERKAPEGKQVFKLSVEAPLVDLLEQLPKRLDLEFQLDRPAIERAGISLNQIISVKVEDVGLDALLAAVLEPAGLKATRRGRVVTIAPAKAAAEKP